MRQATPRARRWLAAAIVVAAVVPAPRSAAQDDPLEPTGRAICNVAFTLAGAVGLTSFVVPPGAPLGPNEVIVALRPILDTCVQLFPPAEPRRCATADLVPRTGLPLTVPDLGGIVSEQVDALAEALGPLGLALTGPLREVFLEDLGCRDAGPQAGSEAGGPSAEPSPPAAPPTTSTGEVTPTPLPTSSEPPVPTGEAVAAPAADAPPGDPPTSLLSSVPAPLRGAAGAVSVGLAALGALAASRLLSRRRAPSLLDLGADEGSRTGDLVAPDPAGPA